ncbi:30S ribosomal protein S10 [Patescibacteria group bacterium]|nr:30S ribosomal protein S10 [Patescibacteria group bacterium]
MAKKKEEAVSGSVPTQKIRIKIKAYDHKVIDQAAVKIVDTVKRLGAEVSGPVPLPTERHRETVIKSPFVNKDSREQFEMRVHKRLIDIIKPSSKIIDSLTNLNLPAGVDVEVKM